MNEWEKVGAGCFLKLGVLILAESIIKVYILKLKTRLKNRMNIFRKLINDGTSKMGKLVQRELEKLKCLYLLKGRLFEWDWSCRFFLTPRLLEAGAPSLGPGCSASDRSRVRASAASDTAGYSGSTRNPRADPGGVEELLNWGPSSGPLEAKVPIHRAREPDWPGGLSIKALPCHTIPPSFYCWVSPVWWGADWVSPQMSHQQGELKPLFHLALLCRLTLLPSSQRRGVKGEIETHCSPLCFHTFPPPRPCCFPPTILTRNCWLFFPFSFFPLTFI